MKINFLIDESSNWKRIMLAWGQVSESNFHWFMIELAKVNGRYHHHHQIVSYYYLPNVTDRRIPFATGVGSWKFNLPSVVVWIKRVGIIQTRLAWLAYTMHLLCTYYAPTMYLLCTYYVPTMYLLCTYYTMHLLCVSSFLWISGIF